MVNEQPDGWNEWSRHVLAELKRLNDCMETVRDDRLKDRRDLDEELRSIHVAIAQLQVKAGIWGGAAGLAAAAIAGLVAWLQGGP